MCVSLKKLNLFISDISTVVSVDIEILKELSNVPGPPGFEDKVRELIAKYIKDYVDELSVDNLGNLIAVKYGKEKDFKVMIAAHMDEVGLLIRFIDNNGFAKFMALGGIDPRILPGQRVVILTEKEPVRGVIGFKPPHITSSEERSKAIPIKDLYIDFGARSAEEAKEMGVREGCVAVFDRDFQVISPKIVTGKAFDDRVGCFVLIETLKRLKETVPTIYAVFTVQEEVGLRGAGVAAYAINPSLAMVLEGTVAADTPEVPQSDVITRVGKGPAIRLIDPTMIAQRKLFEFVVKIAEEEKIPYQIQISYAGGTDAGRIHLTRKGIPSVAISVPVRYIHTPCCLLNLEDVENTIKLLAKTIEKLKSPEQIKYTI